jgi:hypothetical protein
LARAHPHHGQEILSPLKGRIHFRRPFLSLELFPCSNAADHTFAPAFTPNKSRNMTKLYQTVYWADFVETVEIIARSEFWRTTRSRTWCANPKLKED